MGKYDCLTKYLSIFSDNSVGKWFKDNEGDGTEEHPYLFPHVVYSEEVIDFGGNIAKIADKYNLNNYKDILNRNGIEWNCDSMKNADITKLSSDVIIALLLAAFRAEKFCDGALLSFFENGCIEKWLMKLKSNEQEREMSYIKIDDLLRISDSNAVNVKVKFNQNDGNEDPMDLYLRDPDIVNTQWLFWRNKQRYFNVGQIAICLLKLSQETWLLTTIKRVTEEYGVLNGTSRIQSVFWKSDYQVS